MEVDYSIFEHLWPALAERVPAFETLKVHCKNKLVVSTIEWLPWLQTNWRDSGYERFALVLQTNCKRKPNRQLPSSSYNHNTLKTLMTSALSSPDYKFLTATMKCICNDSFTDVLRVVSRLWL